jgi:hypothetical protein
MSFIKEIKTGDIVEYQSSNYSDCNGYKYEINFIFPSGYYDLKALNPNIMTHYTEILSVKRHEFKLIENENKN